MAVKIRLNRLGAKKNPYYRIVVDTVKSLLSKQGIMTKFAESKKH